VSATLGEVNDTGYAYSLQLFGLPTCTTVTLSGGNGFTGTIYAPEAACRINVNGNNTFNFQGACVANSMVVNGHFNFHYDRNLTR